MPARRARADAQPHRAYRQGGNGPIRRRRASTKAAAISLSSSAGRTVCAMSGSTPLANRCAVTARRERPARTQAARTSFGVGCVIHRTRGDQPQYHVAERLPRGAHPARDDVRIDHAGCCARPALHTTFQHAAKR